MILLSKKQVERSRDEQSASMAKERHVLSEAVDGLHRELNSLRESFSREALALRTEHESFAAGILSERQGLLNEISALEERRRQAQMPLTAEGERLKGIAAELDRRSATLTEAFSKLKDERAELAERLADASDILSEAKEKRSEAVRRMAEVEKAESANLQATSDLNARWEDYRLRSEALSADFRSKMSDIEAEKAGISADKGWVAEMRASFDRERADLAKARAELEESAKAMSEADRSWLEDMKKSLSDERKKIESDRLTLAAARDQINRRKI